MMGRSGYDDVECVCVCVLVGDLRRAGEPRCGASANMSLRRLTT